DNYHKYCYRHNPEINCNKQADQAKLIEIQKNLESLDHNDKQNISHIWSIFSAAPSKQKNLILQGILSMCCFYQLSYISEEISNLIKIDFISTLPVQISLKILSYLDCASLCNAAQVSKNWKRLADDDQVWHHMCKQHIDRKCPNCGWGLPLMHMKRARQYDQVQYVSNNQQLQKNPLSSQNSPKITELNNDSLKTRPWKTVYSERFKVERNWRKGIFKIKEFRGHQDGILSLQLNHKILITGSYDSTVKIWDIKSGKLIRTLIGHNKGVRCLKFDDSKLITGSLDSTIKVWNYHLGTCISTYRGHTDSILSIDSYKNKIIVSGSADCTIKVWHVETRICHTLRGHTDFVNCVKIHPASNTIFSCSDDTTIRIWDLKTNNCIKVFQGGLRGHIGQVQTVIPLTIKDNITEDKPDSEGEDDDSKSSSQFSVDSTFNNRNRLQIDNINNSIVDNDMSESSDESENNDIVDTVIPKEFLDKLPSHMLTSSLDNTIKLWDFKANNGKGKCVRTQFGHLEGVWSIAADTFRIVSGAHDRLVKVWDLQSGKCMHTLTGHTQSVTCVDLSDSRLASGDEAGVVRMYCFD
ncbi:ubiquitin-binding SDF ubiquitin ligase complex subunit MET30, partial [Ascoidea rubescens DSM 1968]